MKRSHWTMKVCGAAVLGLGAVGCSTPPQTVPVIQQVVPPAPTPLAANQLGVSPYGTPPGPPTVWDKLGIGKQQREYCRRSLCASPAGAFMGAAIAPMSKLTGGLIPPFCSPVPTNAELLDPGVIGANSKVKQDKLNAEKRKKAVEELANVDCHYWPEAREALIGALRADRNECVRHTAALVLQNGCCCTKETIEALSICASGGDSDGHPCEKSPRVRAAAAIALEQCLERACCNPCGGDSGCAVPSTPPVVDNNKGGTEKPPAPMTESPPVPAPGKGPNADQISWVKPGPVSDEVDPEVAARKFSKAYYDGVKKQSMETVLTRARHRLNTMPPLPLDLSVPAGHPDYEAAGVRTNAVNPDRPANLLDMLNGVTPDKTTKAMAQPMPKTVVAKATVEPTLAKPVEAPKLAVVEKVKPVETPKPVVVEAPKPVMVEKPKPTVAIPQPMPAAAATPIAKVEKIETVSPLAMPVQPPKPLPIRTAMSVSQVTRMLQEPSDLTELRHAIDTLSANDCKDVKLTVALLKAAEYPSDTGFRVACLKAVGRGKPKTNDVKAAVERITHDNDVMVAGEAAKVLDEMKK